MKPLGVPAIVGRATAGKIKKTIDELWIRLNPDYLVLFGGNDIIPMFVVANPSYDPQEDDDERVPTDNPYASSSPFHSSNLKSYLIPDRVVGRIPDMMFDENPAWLVDYLTTATSWASQAAGVYADLYNICCDEWKGAGEDCTKYIGAPASSLLISPPIADQSVKAKRKLSTRLHMIKCHGAQLDPKFYGQRGYSYPEALKSSTLRPLLKSNSLAAAMCCYGAQIYSPNDPAAMDPGEWPISSTYLRKGGLGFVGSTMIAWVGAPQMMCADWIVASYLKGVLGGASLGRALLESKQDYMRWINQQGFIPGIEDEKTMIEFVLLGDPSIHPVGAAPAAPVGGATIALAKKPLGIASEERKQRRVYRAHMATQIREILPKRAPAKGAALAKAKNVFAAAEAVMDKRIVKEFKKFGIRPSKARVVKLSTILRYPAVAVGKKSPRRRALAKLHRQTFAYYWSARQIRDKHKRIQMVKVETDPKGNVLRTALIHSS